MSSCAPTSHPVLITVISLLFQRGNLQDAINAHSIDGAHFSEQEMMRLFRGTCEAVRAMHDFRAAPASSAPSKQASQSKSSSSSRPAPEQAQHRPDSASEPLMANGSGRRSEDNEDSSFPEPEGDGEDGYSYQNAKSIPLVTRRKVQEEGEVIFDGDEELANDGLANGNGDAGETIVVPYAHRDIKPGYILLRPELRLR